jgi:AbrB family looped-hinge helix DNA binding protein
MFEHRVKIGEGGRVVIPAAYRKKLHVKPGDELILRMQDGELRLFRQVQALKHIRETLKGKFPKNVTDDFIEFRKKDSGE